MASVQDTAQNFGLGGGGYADDLDAMLCSFGAIGLVVNEINRDMGLLDLTPELIEPAIQGKLAYIHALAWKISRLAATNATRMTMRFVFVSVLSKEASRRAADICQSNPPSFSSSQFSPCW